MCVVENLLITRRIRVLFFRVFPRNDTQSLIKKKNAVTSDSCNHITLLNLDQKKSPSDKSVEDGDLSQLTNDERIQLANEACGSMCYTNLTGPDYDCSADQTTIKYSPSPAPISTCGSSQYGCCQDGKTERNKTGPYSNCSIYIKTTMCVLHIILLVVSMIRIVEKDQIVKICYV